MTFLPFTRPSIDEETIQDVADVLRSGWITTGPKSAEFEKALSTHCDGRPVRVFTSATFALEAALSIAGVGPGDEVLVPAMTFAATANVVLRVGAVPVMVDVDFTSRNMDLAQAREKITPKTRAMMPVHFAGLPLDMDALYALAREMRLRVVEDAAHAIGSTWNDRPVGGFGDLVVFSFHANKNMTSIEGGAISFPDEDAAVQSELMRFHGIRKDAAGNVDVVMAGGKANLTDVAAAVGLGQLRRLYAFNERRRELVAHYFEMFAGSRLSLPGGQNDAGHSWHMFSPLLPAGADRGGFISAMKERGIGVGIHYPALTTLSLYRQGERCPVAEDIGRRCVTLPLFPAMEDEDVARVVAACRDILG